MGALSAEKQKRKADLERRKLAWKRKLMQKRKERERADSKQATPESPIATEPVASKPEDLLPQVGETKADNETDSTKKRRLTVQIRLMDLEKRLNAKKKMMSLEKNMKVQQMEKKAQELKAIEKKNNEEAARL